MKAMEFTGPVAYHAEGPVWWPRLGCLRFVDMLAGAVLDVAEDGSVTRHDIGSPVAAVLRPRRDGGAVIAGEHGLVLADDDDLTDLDHLAPVVTDDGIRFNEGACDPQGRFWFGTMAYAKTQGAAAMYRFDGERTEQVWGDLTIANGLAWSPDGTLAYFNDTPTGRTDVFDAGPDGLTDRRPFVAHPEANGHPDGLCVDAEGGVWVAMNHGSTVCRFDPAGSLTAVVELPVSQVTACTFGGPDLETLFITTSREGMADGQEPRAGSVFVADPGVRGLPPLEAAF